MAIKTTYKEDDIIITEGSTNKYIYMVLSGSVTLYMNYGKSDEYVIGICGPNKVFGEISALTEDESLYTAVPFTDTVVMVFSTRELDAFLHSYPDQTLSIIKSITRCNKLLSANCKQLLNELNDMSRNYELQKNIVKHSRGIGSSLSTANILNNYKPL